MNTTHTTVAHKIKVVIAVNDLAVGGVQRLAIDQLNFLDRAVFDLYVIVLIQVPGKGDFYDLIPAGIPVYKLHFRNFRDVREWFKTAKILAQVRPDIVKSALFFSNTVFRVLKPFFGYVCIAAEHNTDHLKTRSQILLNKLLILLTYTMVVDSQRVAEYLSGTEGIERNKFTVIYNGVDLDVIRKAEKEFGPQKWAIRRDFGIAPQDKVFLSVSRIVAQKDHRLMIDAFARVAEKCDDARLIIVGDGGLLNTLKEQVAGLNLGRKVIFTGELMDVHRFYSISDFFLVTSRHEGFCIAAMEGLAFGMPLVSTRVAGISEYLQDGINGFFISNDPEDIAQKMEAAYALSPEARERFAQEGKKTSEQYSVARYVESIKDLYLCCLHERSV